MDSAVPTLDQSALSVSQALATAIVTRRQARLDAEAHKAPWKPRRHYASGLSGCTRQMVYAIAAWDQKAPFTADGVAAMQDGTHEERLMIQELLADGFEIVEQQVSLDDEKYWVTGKIDGKLKWLGRRVPFEMKRLKPFAFEKIETVEDMKASPFLLKNLRQLTLYLILHNEEAGLFILSDGLGKRKVVVVPLDYALGESILTSLEEANAALKRIEQWRALPQVPHGERPDDELLPDRIPYDQLVCGYCPFRDVCLPDKHFGPGATLADSALAEKITEFQALKPMAAKLEKLKDEIKAAVYEKEIVVAGTYVVTGKWQERTVAANPAPTSKFWKWEVQSLEKPMGASL